MHVVTSIRVCIRAVIGWVSYLPVPTLFSCTASAVTILRSILGPVSQKFVRTIIALRIL